MRSEISKDSEYIWQTGHKGDEELVRRFSFDNIRDHLEDDSTIVLQGYTNEAFMDTDEAEIVFESGKTKEHIKAKVMTKKLSPIFAAFRSGTTLRYMTFFYINLNANLKQWLGYGETYGVHGSAKKTAGHMSVYIEDADIGKDMVFTCTLSFIRNRLSKLNCVVDDISKENGELKITGWAAERDETRIGLYKVEDNHGIRLASEVEWDVRTDAMEFLPECDREAKYGFKLTAYTNEEKLKLLIQTKRKKKIVNINAVENSSKRMIRNRARLLWQTVEYNLNTIGFAGTMRKAARKLLPGKKFSREMDYNKWRLDYIPTEEMLKKERDDEALFSMKPKFSIVVPMYETPEGLLKELVESVKAQTYSKWELCLADGSWDTTRLSKIVEKLSDGDERIRYIAPKDGGPLGLADNTNQALKEVNGDYVIFCDHDDLLAPNALYECVKLINEEKEDSVHFIYTDEDKIDEAGKVYSMPHFKPDFNIDFLRSVNYFCHMVVVSKKLLDEVGMLRKEFDGAQDYDFNLRCVDKLEEWNKAAEEERAAGSGSLGLNEGKADSAPDSDEEEKKELTSSYGRYKIYHIPKALYHWRTIAASTASDPKAKLYAFEAGKKAIEAHLERRGLKAVVEMGDELGYYDVHYSLDDSSPFLSIIIPNKDHISDLKTCMDSIDKYSVFKDYEFVIVENNSTEPETFEFYKELEKRENVQVLYWKDEFNYSAINNFGAKSARGDYFLLLNNDTEMINPDAIADMLGFCKRPDVGAVGARLYYNDDTLQHAGVVMGFGGIAGHCFVAQSEEPGSVYFNRSKMTSDYSAVTAACLMVRRDVFEKLNGLDETFKVAFNDIDFCLRIRRLGLLIVYDAWARFHHYESKSRGLEDTAEKKERFRREVTHLQQNWGDILSKGDPYYNPNLSLERQDFSLKL